MKTTRWIAVLALPLALAGGGALAAAGDSQVLKYSVTVKGEKVGWSRAVVKDTSQGKVVNVIVKMKTKVLGQDFSMHTTMKTRYDDDGRAAYFESMHDSPRGQYEVTGKMTSSGGYEVVRVDKDGKTEKKTLSAKSFDVVSVEPALYDGSVGSKTKKKVLFTSSGEVKKVTVIVMGRSEKEVMGETTTVTHVKVKGFTGSTEEWRTEEGVMVKSRISTPLGKIVVRLLGQSG